ncbi:SDR family NAD(P)-dependent oxidoreductase [Raoultella terrigena]
MNSFDYTGKTALVTGASSGIGRVFAQQLAARGVALILTARSELKLQVLAAELERDHGVSVTIIVQDLMASDAIPHIAARLDALRLYPDILINNAGFATYGPFETLSLERQREEIKVNCLAPVELTHALLPKMQLSGSGVIINVASTAAMQPDPYMAVYGATKSFLLSFSNARFGRNIARAASAYWRFAPAQRIRPFLMWSMRRRLQWVNECRLKAW